MKKTFLITLVLLSGFIFENATAQIRLGVNINIGDQPLWGPVGYDHVDYYYMPDIDAYYSVPKHQYIYLQGSRWIFSATLPSRFHYDINSGYKVVVNEPTPYLHANVYRQKYASFKGNRGQQIIRNSNENKYWENKNHPQHNKWKNNNNNGRGKAFGDRH